MSKYPDCDQKILLPECEVEGCDNPAEWNGWYRYLDPLLKTPTDLIRKCNVCDLHRRMLIDDGSAWDGTLKGKAKDADIRGR